VAEPVIYRDEVVAYSSAWPTSWRRWSESSICSERTMAKRKLTEAERERFRIERERARANARRLRELAERAQAELDAKRSAE
jgi:hypothetical protein